MLPMYSGATASQAYSCSILIQMHRSTQKNPRAKVSSLSHNIVCSKCTIKTADAGFLMHRVGSKLGTRIVATLRSGKSCRSERRGLPRRMATVAALPVQSFAANALDRSIAERRDADFVQTISQAAQYVLVAGSRISVDQGQDQAQLRWFSAAELEKLGLEALDGVLKADSGAAAGSSLSLRP